MSKNLIITIDGPAGSGKSSVARRLALELAVPYIDTGAMYRTVAHQALEQGASVDDEEALVHIAEVLDFRFAFRGKKSVVYCRERGGSEKEMGDEIRQPEVSMAASSVGKHPKLRQVLVKKQQEIGALKGGVLEGRDAGTVIFPNAPLKFFITASTEVRAARRGAQLNQRFGSEAPSHEEVLKSLRQRDDQDSQRAASPMKPAEDAEVLDTSDMTEEEVFSKLMDKAKDYLTGAS